MLEIKKEAEGRISLVGRLDAAEVERIQPILAEVNQSVEIDLSGLEYISSAGLGMFIALHTRLAKDNKTLTLRNPTDMVRNVFRLSRLDQLITLK